MKEAELRAIAKCAFCYKPFGHTGLLFFWRVTIERHGVDAQAVQRQDGLAQFLGSSRLANVMGDDRDMTKPVMEPVTLTVCERCAVSPNTVFALLIEAAHRTAGTEEPG